MVLRRQNDGETDDVVWFSQPRRDGALLALQDLPKGTYFLNITEITVDPHAGCATYDFNFHTSRSEASDKPRLQSKGVSDLPGSLEGMGALGFNGHAELSGTYLLLEDGGKNLTFAVPLSEDALVHVHVHPVDLSLPDIHIEVLDNHSAKVTSAVRRMLVVLKGPGQYSLQLTPVSPFPRLADHYYSLDLEVVPTPAVFARMAHVYTPPVAGCVTSKLPDVVPSPTSGIFLFHDALTFSREERRSKSSASTTFIVSADTHVYAKISFFFPLDDLDLYLQEDGADGPGRVIYGSHHYNTVELNAMVPDGRYTLVVNSPLPIDLDKLLGLPPTYCSTYTLSIHLSPSVNDPSRVDCTTLDELPYSLNAEGVSDAYGGPIKDGQLMLVGTTFLAPKLGDVKVIDIDLNEESVVSMMMGLDATVREEEESIKIIVFDTGDDPRQALNTLVTQSPHDLVHHTYFLPANTYTVVLFFPALDMQFSSPCPRFTFAATVQPATMLKHSLHCPATMPTGLPQKTPQFDKAYSEKLDSMFTVDLHDLEADYVIGPFQLHSEHWLTASMSFNSLASMLYLTIANSEGLTVNSRLEALEKGSELYDRQALLHHLLVNGTYTLTIHRKVFVDELGLAQNTQTVCVPFLWDLQIGEKTREVISADPPALVDFNPTYPLEITISSFSQIFSKEQRPASASIIHDAFYLSGGWNPLVPVSASGGEDEKTWVLKFTGLTPSTTYSLSLREGTLFTRDRVELVLEDSYTYVTVSSTCSGHGTMASGKCVCDTGFTLSDCSACDVGYVDVGIDSLDCVTQDSVQCRPDSCGCEPGTAGDTCIPRGTCVMASMRLTCRCRPEYTGQRCELCTNGLPFPCKPANCDSCVHGICDVSTGKCVQCHEGYSGEECDICADGYHMVALTGQCQKNDYSISSYLFLVIGLVVAALIIGAIALWIFMRRSKPVKVNYFPVDLDDEPEATELDLNLMDEGGTAGQPDRENPAPASTRGDLDFDFNPRT